jgi:hypothetical protein
VESGRSQPYEAFMSVRTLIGALALLVLGAEPAWAYCPPNLDYSITGEFRRADIVAIVRTERVTWLDENRRPTKLRKPLTFGNQPGGFDPYIGAYYSVRLVKAFKGHPPLTFRVFSENTTARTPLRMRPNLLLFLTRTRAADEYERVGDLTVDSCGNSSLATARKVALLQRLATHR